VVATCAGRALDSGGAMSTRRPLAVLSCGQRLVDDNEPCWVLSEPELRHWFRVLVTARFSFDCVLEQTNCLTDYF